MVLGEGYVEPLLVEIDGDLVEPCCGVCIDACGPGNEDGVAPGASAL